MLRFAASTAAGAHLDGAAEVAALEARLEDEGVVVVALQRVEGGGQGAVLVELRVGPGLEGAGGGRAHLRGASTGATRLCNSEKAAPL